jgi:hypothetical protein
MIPPQNAKTRLDLIRWRAKVITQTLQDTPETFTAEEMRYVLNMMDEIVRKIRELLAAV